MDSELFRRLGTVVLLYDESAAAGDAASRDVFLQLDAVEDAVRTLGGKTARLGVGLDLAAFKSRLAALLAGSLPGLAFNLAESLDGSDRLQTIVPLLLEDWRIPYTGNGSAAMLASNHKIASKRRLAERGLPVPECVWLDAGENVRALPEAPKDAAGDWILKAVESHASVFLDDASVLRGVLAGVAGEAARRATRERGQAFFAERFIDGREFNLSVLEDAAGGARVLPAAEIDFSGLPDGKPRLVGYAAKWEEDSPEYLATPRTFRLGAEDAGLAAELKRLALATWEALGLSGYARVDFRVDGEGRPFILEANANPCLTPDAGFAAAAGQAGLGYAALVDAIARAALRRRP